MTFCKSRAHSCRRFSEMACPASFKGSQWIWMLVIIYRITLLFPSLAFTKLFLSLPWPDFAFQGKNALLLFSFSESELLKRRRHLSLWTSQSCANGGNDFWAQIKPPSAVQHNFYSLLLPEAFIHAGNTKKLICHVHLCIYVLVYISIRRHEIRSQVELHTGLSWVLVWLLWFVLSHDAVWFSVLFPIQEGH